MESRVMPDESFGIVTMEVQLFVRAEVKILPCYPDDAHATVDSLDIYLRTGVTHCMHQAAASQTEKQRGTDIFVQQQAEYHSLCLVMFELPGTCRDETALLDPFPECQVSLAIALMDADLAEVILLAVNQYAGALIFLCHLVRMSAWSRVDTGFPRMLVSLRGPGAQPSLWQAGQTASYSGGDDRQPEAFPGLHATPVILDPAGGIACPQEPLDGCW